MAAGRGRWRGGGTGGVPFALLLRGALLSLLPLTTPDPSVTHRYENVKVVEISLQPTVFEEIISEGKVSVDVQQTSRGDIASQKEEQNLNDLVNLLQDVVKNIPTGFVVSTEQPSTGSVPNSSPSVPMDTVWVNMKPRPNELSKTIAMVKKVASTTTPFWKLRNDASASVVLHADTDSPSENVQSETNKSVPLSEEATVESTLATVSVQAEDKITERKENKSFDLMTNGALASLVESLKNVKHLHMKLNDNEPHQKGSLVKLHPHKPGGIDVLAAIDALIESIKNAPTSVKEDPALHEYVQEAEGYLKNALELAGEAERKLLLKKEQQMKADLESHSPSVTEMKLDFELPSSSEAPATEVKLDVEVISSPSTAPPVSEVELEIFPSSSETPSVTEVDILLASTESLEQKAEEAQIEMGKLKAFINLLYGFSPQLTEYAKNSPNKKIAQDIVERSMEVLDAIKSVFCGSSERQSKQVLKQLLQKDMELLRQAMKEKKVS